MFIRLLIALLVLVGLMAFLGWYGKASDEDRNRALKNLLIWGIAGALLLLVITGRIPWLFAIISAALPFWRKIMAARSLLGTFQRFTGQSFNTRLTTQWLRIQFDVVARKIDAEILQGQYTGQHLSQLDDAAVQTLLDECSADKQSVAAIHAYLRARHSGWGGTSSPASINTELSRTQALEILGLEETASEDDIRKAHKRLMQKVHPDRGGSDYLAAQINAAKDYLLNDNAPS